MSLPLPRRIAQAALLLGAAAAPLIGAGAAHAATTQPQLNGLGGLSSLDTGSLGNADLGGTVNGASHQATTLADHSGTQALDTALPAADHVVGTAGTTGVPIAQHAAAQGTDAAGRIAGATGESAGGAVPGAESLPLAALPNTGNLPLGTPLATDQLPLR
ncbi:hypothetical protein SAMN05216223_102164 [Actinacidiphila yanglinensis]|uniref:ATP-binding protein n=1 Tax=Actinacidiphila yanglinensis TaxID=310779 RepID=A0A1H5V7G8_9ACTN|nr:ATP-binding protein [Actinacidiphila yanglinensis]SEF82691.1 hypothetical protein SAMN05216223_102164 [Actinacidiphila yanglinensis]